jgi:hypothetical protein
MTCIFEFQTPFAIPIDNPLYGLIPYLPLFLRT